MFATALRCRACHHTIPISLQYHCSICNGILEVIYDYESLGKSEVFHSALRGTSPYSGMWRYYPMLPLKDPTNIVSLGEGNTPLLPAPRLGRLLGVPQLFLKNEGANPTASFKDRPSSTGISIAKEFGVKQVIIASSGNAGAATAAYAARAGLPCFVVVPEGTPFSKVAQALSSGARVIFTKGSYSNSYQLAHAAAVSFGWANLSSTFLNPFTVEGDKTIAYEIWEQLRHRVPDWIIIPIGAGPLLVGTLKGYEELKRFGLIKRLPAMVGVQSEAVHPIADAFAANKTIVEEWHGNTKTVASGIADPLIGYPQDGTLTLMAIRSSGGQCLVAPDVATLEMGRKLAQTEGLFIEPTAATGIYGVLSLRKQGYIDSHDLVVVLLTAHGLKMPEAYEDVSFKPPVVNTLEELQVMLSCKHI